MVQCDELGSVGKGRLDLNLLQQFGHTFHDVVSSEHRAPVLHQVYYAAAVSRCFEDPRRQDGDRLGVIKPQSSRSSLTREVGGNMDQELFLLVRRDQHARIIAWGRSVGQT